MRSAFNFYHLKDDGLTSLKDVASICQDKTGFIWIGTATGLYRYDGYRFRQFRHDPADPDSLSHNDVTDLEVDAQGRLWIATNGGGVCRFNPEDQSFTSYRRKPGNANSINGDVVFTVFVDSKGSVWCGGPPPTWLNKFDPASQTWTRFVPEKDNDDSMPPKSGVWEIVEDKTGGLWIAADFVLLALDPRTGIFRRINLNPMEKRLNELLLDRKGLLWCGGTSGLYQVDVDNGRVVRSFLNLITGIDSLCEIESGDIAVGTTREGLFFLDAETGDIISHHVHDPSIESSLCGNGAPALYQDDDDMIWIGSNDGLDLLNPKQTQFRNFVNNPQNNQTMAPGQVEALDGDDEGFLWVGAGGVLNRINPAAGWAVRYDLIVGDRSLAALSFSSIYCDRDGYVWFGMRDDPGLYRLDPNSGFIESYLPLGDDEPQGPPPEITGFFEDRQRNLFLAVDHYGLFLLDRDRRRFTARRERPARNGTPFPMNPAVDRITVMTGGRNGNIWLGSPNGSLTSYNIANGTFTHFIPDSTKPKSLPPNRIIDIFEDESGVVWLAEDGGLVRFDPREKTALEFTDKDGLPSLAVVGIMEDNNGELWLAAKSGLSRFNPRDNGFF